MSATSSAAPIAIVLISALTVWYMVRRNEKRILLELFPAPSEPAGPSISCQVRFATEEGATPCIVKPTNRGWYMFSPKENAPARRWNLFQPYLRQPVRIPWEQLSYHPAKFPMRSWLRFDVPSAKVTFFIRQEAARDILTRGGRPFPSAEIKAVPSPFS